MAFRIFKALLEEKYGKAGARGRIYATTDARKGALKGLADAEGYEEFVVPDAVGGRYSVLTAVGLLPIAAAGIDVDRLLSGARELMEALAVPGRDNLAWQYAAARNALYDAGKAVELLVGYEPSFRFFAEWWKQLFEFACGVSGYLLGVNPFDQPGVEAYKKNMFALLGKPGYEALRAELEQRL